MTVVGAQWECCEVGGLLVPFSVLARFRKCYLNAVEPVCKSCSFKNKFK